MNILYCLTDLSFLLINLSTHFCLLLYLCCVQFCVHDNQIGQYQCVYFPCASRENRCKTTFYHQTAFLKKRKSQKRFVITMGILKSCSILDNTMDRAEPDSPMTARREALPPHTELSSWSGPFSRARAALWPVSGYPQESKIVYPSLWLGSSSALRFISSTASLIVCAQRKALGSKLQWCMHCTQPAHPQQRLMKCKFQQLKNNRQTGIANRIWKKNSPTAFHWHWPVRAV